MLAGGRGGLIWHYQGTGKSLLMAFAALMLLNDPDVGGPTVVVVLDRLDLIEQIQRQFRTAGLPGSPSRNPKKTCGGCCARTAAASFSPPSSASKTLAS